MKVGFSTYLCIYSLVLFSAWDALWPLERKRQRSFFLFGLALILELDIEGIRAFFHTFFRLPDWYDLFSLICFPVYDVAWIEINTCEGLSKSLYCICSFSYTNFVLSHKSSRTFLTYSVHESQKKATSNSTNLRYL